MFILILGQTLDAVFYIEISSSSFVTFMTALSDFAWAINHSSVFTVHAYDAFIFVQYICEARSLIQ